MIFLYPSFFWALPVLIIPVIVHLFHFRKTKKILFSNTRFLRQIQQATSAKRKLKHWLILTARILFLFFLILTFTQPFIPASEQLNIEKGVVIYIDNSQSMSIPVKNSRQVVDLAISTAKQLVESLPPETPYRLLTNDFAPFSNSLKKKSEILDLLAQLRLSGVSRTATEVASRIAQIGSEREIFWISDFQQSTLGNAPLSDSVRQWYLFPVNTESVENIYIDTAYLSNPFAIGKEKNTLNVKFHNAGTQAREQLQARLVIDGVQAGTASVSVPANGFGEAVFDLTNNRLGYRAATITFTDPFAIFDNEFYAVFNFSERISILEIKPDIEKTIIEKIFGNTSVFNFNKTHSNRIDYNQLMSSDLVIVNGLPQLDNALLDVLHKYLNTGRSVLFIPAPIPDISSYKKLLPAITEYNQLKPLALARPDLSNPFFTSVFEEQSAQLSMPVVSNVVSWGNDRQALLKQQDNTPYLSVFGVDGKLYVFGSPIEATYGSFFNHGIIVPVMYRIAAHSKRDYLPLYYSLSQSDIRFPCDSLQPEELISIVGRVEYIPSQRYINGEVLVDINGLELTSGHYIAKNDGGDTLACLAFNQESAESILHKTSTQDLITLFGRNTHLYSFSSTSEQIIQKEIANRFVGRALWKYALLATLFFLLLEILGIWFNNR